MAEFPITEEYIEKFVILNEIGQWESFRTEERIVRCKDCKYYDHEELFDDDMWWCVRGASDENVFEVEPYGFCKWGERR